MSDIDPPHGYTLAFEGQGGAAGFAKGDAKVSLAPAENGAATALSYTVNAQVGGKIAQIGSRLVDGAAQKLADDFFARFAEAVAATAGVPAAAPARRSRRRSGPGCAMSPSRSWWASSPTSSRAGAIDRPMPSASAAQRRRGSGVTMDSVDLEVLKRCAEWLSAGRRVQLVTVVKTWGSSPRPPGAMLAVRDDGIVEGSVSGGCVEDDLVGRVRADGMTAKECAVVTYGVSADEARRFGLPCGGTIQLVLEPLAQRVGHSRPAGARSKAAGSSRAGSSSRPAPLRSRRRAPTTASPSTAACSRPFMARATGCS